MTPRSGTGLMPALGKLIVCVLNVVLFIPYKIKTALNIGGFQCIIL